MSGKTDCKQADSETSSSFSWKGLFVPLSNQVGTQSDKTQSRSQSIKLKSVSAHSETLVAFTLTDSFQSSSATLISAHSDQNLRHLARLLHNWQLFFAVHMAVCITEPCYYCGRFMLQHSTHQNRRVQ